MDISATTLVKTIQELLLVLPPDVVQKIVTPTYREIPQGLPNLVKNESKIHPFSLRLATLEVEAAKSVSEGMFSLSDASVFLLDALVNLKKISTASGFRALVDRLVPSTQYFSTLFEASVAAGYIAAGYRLQIVPETADFRTPDLRVVEPDSSVDIECKSLEDLSFKEQKLLSHLQIQLTRLLQRRRKALRIFISAGNYLSGQAVSDIVTAVKNVLRRDDTIPGPMNVGDFELRFVGLGSASEWTPLPLEIEGGGKFAWMELECTTRMILPSYRMATCIEFEPWHDENHTKRIFRLIDDASSQFAHGHSGLVHIQIPYLDAIRSEAIFDSCFNRVFGYLRRNHPRINAVVLESSSVDKNARNGGNMILRNSVVIPNPAAAMPLPKEFRILKPDAFDLDMVNSGVICIDFELHSSVSRELGKQLYFQCSSDGHYQLRIWQSHTNYFRVDVVDPFSGRTTKLYPAHALETLGPHKIALRYHQPVACALDGKMLEEFGADAKMAT